MSATAFLRTSRVSSSDVDSVVTKVLSPALQGRWRIGDPIYSTGCARLPIFGVPGVLVHPAEVDRALNRGWAWRRFKWAWTLEACEGTVVLYLELRPRTGFPASVTFPVLVLVTFLALLYARRFLLQP